MNNNDSYQYIGTITRPFGVRGECYLADTQAIPSLNPKTEARLGFSASFGKPAKIEYIKQHKGGAIIKMVGTNDISGAELLRELGVFVQKSAMTLQPNTYFTDDIVGCTMIHSSTGVALGVIVDVWNLPTYNALVVRTESGDEVGVPDVPDFILSVDIPNKKVIAHPPEGLFGDMVSENDE